MSQSRTDNYLSKYSNINTKGLSFQQNDPLIADVLSKAGSSEIYSHRLGLTSEVSNFNRGNTVTLPQLVPKEKSPRYGPNDYRINEDNDPIRITRPIDFAIDSPKQNIKIRYLEPPNLPKPNPIIIRERQQSPPPAAPPIYIRQYQKAPPTPPPLIIRERPPVAPSMPEITYIEKIVLPPTPPPRQVIIERIPAPQKPRQIIYEKWLPYKPLSERDVLVERSGKFYEKQPNPKNIIIDYENPKVSDEKVIFNEGTIRADPRTYESFETENKSKPEIRLVNKIDDVLVNYDSKMFSSSGDQGTSLLNSSNSTTALNKYKPIESNTKPTESGATANSSQMYVAKGGIWNTTYRSSYTGQGFKVPYKI